jgi:hypothetical protein
LIFFFFIFLFFVSFLFFPIHVDTYLQAGIATQALQCCG